MTPSHAGASGLRLEPTRGPCRRRRRALAFGPVLLAAAFVVASCTSSGGGAPVTDDAMPPTTPPDTLARPFAPDSPWNTAIPADVALDEESADMVAALTEEGAAYALIHEHGVPVYEADADTPTVSITCMAEDWGPCSVEDHPVPMPAEAEASSGDDGALVVIDRAGGRVYDFWQAEQTSSGEWTASWGTWTELDGDGRGGSTGAGINLLAGLVRTSELRVGRIDHALAFASDLACPEVYRYPAMKTDGHATSSPCVPQGVRLQLDPSIDVAAIPDITPGEIAVAEALQTYGGYVRDSAGSALAVAFETPTGGDDPYQDVGFPWDYYDMPHIPWDQLRVLSEWDGS